MKIFPFRLICEESNFFIVKFNLIIFIFDSGELQKTTKRKEKKDEGKFKCSVVCHDVTNPSVTNKSVSSFSVSGLIKAAAIKVRNNNLLCVHPVNIKLLLMC